MEKNKVVNVEEMGGRGDGADYTSEHWGAEETLKVKSYHFWNYKFCIINARFVLYTRGKGNTEERSGPVIIGGADSGQVFITISFTRLPRPVLSIKVHLSPPPTVEAAVIGASPILLQGATGSGSYSSCLHCRQDARTFIAGQEEKRDFDFFFDFLIA